MIRLKSDKKMSNQRKDGYYDAYIYVEGEYLGQSKINIKFRETYYYIFEEYVDVPLLDEEGNPQQELVKTKVILPESISQNTMKLRMNDFGPNPTAEQIASNQNTVEYLYQAFGVDISKNTGYADGVEANFEHIFKMVQFQKKYYGVGGWIVESQT